MLELPFEIYGLAISPPSWRIPSSKVGFPIRAVHFTSIASAGNLLLTEHDEF
jgi:hypothetical protein